MSTPPMVYYCQWVVCGRHFDAFHPDALPTRCPWCHSQGWWDTTPPPFDARLTETERRWLRCGTVRDGHLGATEKS